MKAWKLLNERSTTPFSDFVWPTPDGESPGAWVEANGPVVPCRSGIHACTTGDLSWWLSANLWEIELDGPVIRADRQVVAPRGRITAAISEWSATQEQLSGWCCWRSRDNAVELLNDAGQLDTASDLAAVDDAADVADVVKDFTGEAITSLGIACVLAAGAATLPNPVIASHVGARAAGNLACARAGGSAEEYYAAFADERRAQSRWLADLLGLSDAE